MTQFSSTNAGVPVGPGISDNLYLKVFSGEVLKTFRTATVMASRHRVRTIKSGTTAQFPAIGKAVAEYHQPGQVILGQDVEHGEKTLVIDDLLLSSVFLANIEEAMKHYETRSELVSQMGESLAQAFDQHLFAIATKATKDGATGAVTGMGPATEDKLGTTPTLANFVDAIYNAAAYFDSTNVPKNDRVCFVTPDMYWDMIRDGNILNRDFGNTAGSQQTGGKLNIAGIEIVVTNNLALNFGVDTPVGVRNGVAHDEYTVDGSATLGLVMQKSALGTVQLLSISSESKYQVERQGSLLVTKRACGHGVLRPEGLRLISAVAAA